MLLKFKSISEFAGAGEIVCWTLLLIPLGAWVANRYLPTGLEWLPTSNETPPSKPLAPTVSLMVPYSVCLFYLALTRRVNSHFLCGYYICLWLVQQPGIEATPPPTTKEHRPNRPSAMNAQGQFAVEFVNEFPIPVVLCYQIGSNTGTSSDYFSSYFL